MNRIVRAGRGVFVYLAKGGRVGVGECSPLPGRSPDAIDDDVRALAAAARLEEIAPSLPAARFALESALLDLAAQERGLAVAELLARAPARELPASAVVPLGGRASASTWKVKIGRGDLDGELDALRAMRRGCRHLRLDLNRAWSREQAARHLPRLADLEPEWVEEPVSAADLILLGPQPVPIALDESLLDQPAESAAALERGLVGAVVLKPALLGGLAACLAWAERARAAGAVPIASHLFDGPVALAATIELALAIARPGDPAPGLGDHEGLRAYPPARIPQLDGDRLLSHRPGLGVAP